MPMRPYLDASATVLSLGLLAVGGMAAAPVMAQTQTGGVGGDVAFSLGEISVVGGMLAFIIGGLVAVFKLLLASNAAALTQKDAAHAEAIRLKDETQMLLTERLKAVFGQLTESQEHNNKQTDQLIVLLTGVVKNNESSIKDMATAIRDMTASMTETAARDSQEHLAVLEAIRTLAEERKESRQAALAERAQDRQERRESHERIERQSA